MVSKHLKTMEREKILRSYEKKGDSKGLIRKYYSIIVSRTFLVTVAPNIFQYKSLDLNTPEFPQLLVPSQFQPHYTQGALYLPAKFIH